MLSYDLLNQYLESHPYGIADRSALMMRYALSGFGRFCGSSDLHMLTTDNVNGWIDQLRHTRAPDTVRSQRGSVLTLWWFAYREGLVEEPPLKVRRLRPIHRSPTAWTVEEVRALIAAAEVYPTRPLWTASLIRAGYDSGARLGDLLAIKCESVSPRLMLTQHKTGRTVHVQLRPATLQSIRLHLAGRTEGLVWPLWGRREALYRHIRRVVRSAAIRPGTFKWLRRSAATACERVQPGSGTVLLGHASRSTTEAWYIDRSLLSTPPLPEL